jgi:hypothetical protein
MKRIILLLMTSVAILLAAGFLYPDDPKDEYIILGWNDLGMHCANKDFSKLVILPPYNNLIAHVIKKGTATTLPEVLTSGYSVTYGIPGNTYSVGKTNFWDYEDQIFGVNLPDNIGLTGVGLTGQMQTGDNYFHVEGIPVTPYTDANLQQEDPFQLALMEVYLNNNLIASTQNVIPVSNEINCVSSGCHSSEMGILYSHEQTGGFDPNNTPILCAGCHGSNALGIQGTPGLGSLSEVIHEKHGGETNDCYKCHPGPNTQCLRDVMHTAGMVCQDCHGSVTQVAQSIQQGREPWLEEPSCGIVACHGPNFSPEPGKLYRQSKGHGGLYCSTCHGSPHALVPSENDRDNLQNVNLQGFAGPLKKCSVCHGSDPSAPGPHGFYASVVEYFDGLQPGLDGLVNVYPNPAHGNASIVFSLTQQSRVHIELFSLDGKSAGSLVNQQLGRGTFRVSIDLSAFPAGIYLCTLQAGGKSDSRKIIVD